jgi:hypothetical protein
VRKRLLEEHLREVEELPDLAQAHQIAQRAMDLCYASGASRATALVALGTATVALAKREGHDLGDAQKLLEHWWGFVRTVGPEETS